MKKVIFPNSALVAQKILSNSGLTQAQLGEMLGYKKGQFSSNNARGLSAFPPKHWNKLAELGGIDVEELLEAYLKDKEAWIREILWGDKMNNFKKNITEKPLGRSTYGSIAHLPGSKEGFGDKRITPGQASICWEKPRDKHDLIIVQEKLDGSCVSIARKDGSIVGITRAGFLASTSRHKQHHMFSDWLSQNQGQFDFLGNGERVVGEWLAQAHGTIYGDLPSPFFVFDLFSSPGQRSTFDEFRQRCSHLQLPRTIHEGGSFSKEKMLSAMETQAYGAVPEGVVYRVYRKGVFDFAAKYVRDNYEPGKYLQGVSGHEDVWNWQPREGEG